MGSGKIHHGERLNTWTHLAGAILACNGAAWLLVAATLQGNPWQTASVVIYSLTLVLLYRVFGDTRLVLLKRPILGRKRTVWRDR